MLESGKEREELRGTRQKLLTGKKNEGRKDKLEEEDKDKEQKRHAMIQNMEERKKIRSTWREHETKG